MFTGIVKELGIVRGFNRAGNVYTLDVTSKVIFDGLVIGDSVSVNGVCLTLVAKSGGVLSFDVMEESVRRTALERLKAGSEVNLEDSMKAGSPLGGHFVLGHVDCIGNVQKVQDKGREFILTIKIPQESAHLIVEKGSVAIDGISLTVGEVGRDHFSVYIIPHTLKITNLGKISAGDKVNIEFDIIGKYLARFRELGGEIRITECFLKENGF